MKIEPIDDNVVKEVHAYATEIRKAKKLYSLSITEEAVRTVLQAVRLVNDLEKVNG